jgi:hypothetical protein
MKPLLEENFVLLVYSKRKKMVIIAPLTFTNVLLLHVNTLKFYKMKSR